MHTVFLGHGFRRASAGAGGATGVLGGPSGSRRGWMPLLHIPLLRTLNLNI